MNFIFSSANVYADMSNTFYKAYLETEELYQKEYEQWTSTGQKIALSAPVYTLLSQKEKQATAAIVFQALAIEAYTNLWGSVVFGNDQYKPYERRPIEVKLNIIASSYSSEYPSDHREKIISLFDKRDELVHSKSKEYEIEVSSSYDYEHPENNFLDLSRFYSEQFFVFENIEEQMKLYKELQENIMIIRDSDTELIEEIRNREISEATKAIDKTILKLFGL